MYLCPSLDRVGNAPVKSVNHIWVGSMTLVIVLIVSGDGGGDIVPEGSYSIFLI